jgi:hypothetical protein
MKDAIKIAAQCLKFSSLVYTEADLDEPRTSTQVKFGGPLDDPDAIIISFRGSKEPRDYLNDSKFWFKARFPWRLITKARVHRGFLDGYLSVQDRVATRVLTAKRIYVTGHSLGGAKAMVCALNLHQAGFPIAGVHVFGCPRVGNDDWAELYDANLRDVTFRWEAQGDPVPWLPPLLNNYRHAGRAAYLKRDGRIIIEPALWEHVPAFVQQIGRAPKSLLGRFLKIFDPHFVTNYEGAFGQLKEAA